MYCRKCGAKNEDGAKFCTTCGAPLVSGETEDGSPEQVASPKATPATDKAAPAASTAPTSQPQPQPNSEPGKKRRTAIVAVAIVAACCAVGVAGWLIYSQVYLPSHEKAITHPVTIAMSFSEGSADLASKVPVHVTGKDIEGTAVDEVAYVAADGTGLTLKEGTYDLTVEASPILSDGTIFDVSNQAISVTIDSSGATVQAESDGATTGEASAQAASTSAATASAASTAATIGEAATTASDAATTASASTTGSSSSAPATTSAATTTSASATSEAATTAAAATDTAATTTDANTTAGFTFTPVDPADVTDEQIQAAYDAAKAGGCDSTEAADTLKQTVTEKRDTAVEQVKQEESKSHYDVVLAAYKASQDNGWADSGSQYKSLTNLEFAETSYKSFGTNSGNTSMKGTVEYAYYDLGKDGTPDLLIGIANGTDWPLAGAFSWDGSKVTDRDCARQLVSRTTMNVLSDGSIQEIASNGASGPTTTQYGVINGALVQMNGSTDATVATDIDWQPLSSYTS